MPTTTDLGFPVPNDDDPVADGALATRNLGTFLDENVGVIATGTAQIDMNGVSANDIDVDFPLGRFAAAPKVVATANVDRWICATGSVTTSKFNLRVRHHAGGTGAGPVMVDWIAIRQ